MRKAVLSFALHIFSVPVLGSPQLQPMTWVYGEQESFKNSAEAYAPQLHLACTIMLTEAKEIARERVYLNDVAQCKGPQTLCRDVMRIDIGASPKPGLNGRLKRIEIQEILQQEYPQHHFEVNGQETIFLHATAVSPNMDQLKSAIVRGLERESGALRFHLQGLRASALVKLRHGNYDYEFPQWREEMERLRQYPRRTMVTLRVRVRDLEADSSELFEMPVQLSLKAEMQTLVANRTMARGTLVQSKDFVSQWLPFQENMVRDTHELAGKSLRMGVREGQALRVFELMQEPDIRRGEKIDATVFSGGVKMNSSGQAMETGSIGQKIRIQIDSTKRQVMGLIIAKSTVEVQMP